MQGSQSQVAEAEAVSPVCPRHSWPRGHVTRGHVSCSMAVDQVCAMLTSLKSPQKRTRAGDQERAVLWCRWRERAGLLERW